MGVQTIHRTSRGIFIAANSGIEASTDGTPTLPKELILDKSSIEGLRLIAAGTVHIVHGRLCSIYF